MGKMRRTGITPRAGRMSSPPPPAGFISFSYRYYVRTAKFNMVGCTGVWFEALVERLRAVSSLQPQEVLSSRSPALRAHPIDFSRTSEPLGFAHLNPQLREYTPYQFQLSKEKGRVHGFFIDLIFYVVWLDPHHRLYP